MSTGRRKGSRNNGYWFRDGRGCVKRTGALAVRQRQLD